MIPLTAISATKPGNPWLSAIYAAILTAIAAYAAGYFLQADQLVPFAVALLLTGIGPVLGYALTTGRVGTSIPGIIGGIIGAIPVVSVILWPLLVGLFTRTQSIGKLFLGSLIGVIVALALFFGLASTIGQDPSWFNLGFVAALAIWAAISSAAMTGWAKY